MLDITLHPRAEDREIATIEMILDLLREYDGPTQRRILDYLLARTETEA
jgi:hypothetical protein